MSNFITIENDETKLKMNNLFLVSIFIGFIWILFHFTIIFFFGLILESVFLVGLFLGIGNIIALLVDIPIGVLQKYIKPKTFLIIASTLLLLTSLIFLKFIFFEGISDVVNPSGGVIEKTISYLGEFLNSTFNIFLLLLSACLYGLIKESFDVTTLSYIFNNSSPSEYAGLISKYNIYFGGGGMIGLLFSGILLAFNIKVAIVIFIILTVIFIRFILTYFDNTSKTINIEDFKKIRNIKLDSINLDLSKKSEQLISKISTKNLIDLSRNTKVILLKPIEIKNSLDFKDIFKTTQSTFKSFYSIIFGKPINIIIFWVLLMIMQFGFWDTFVSTFQVEFLNKVISLNKDTYLIKQTGGLITGYLLLGILILPAFLLQSFFINLSKKIGIFRVIMFGLTISGFSLFLFGLVDQIYFIVLFGILNSVGYAATMPISQALFSEIYNVSYAKKFNLTEIDTTVSAAPLKIVLNFANVVGLILGGIIVGIVGFNGFFIFFSLIMFALLSYSLLNFKNFSKPFGEEGINKTENIPQNQSIDNDFV